MNRLDQFLSVAARQMRVMPAALRDDELRELRGHLQQRIEDYANQGMSDDAAQLRALEGLGSARALGSKLCDAWEGIAFNWWRVLAAIVGVTALLSFGILTLLFAITLVPLNAEIALLPEVVPLLCGLYLSLPLGCGLLFSHWLGRRGCLVATLYVMALAGASFTVTFPTGSAGFAAPPPALVAITQAPWFPVFWIALAFAGAWSQNSWRRRKRRQLALSGARSVAPSRFLVVPLNFDWWRNLVLVLVVGGALYATRVWLRLHPQTPEATLRNDLILNRQGNSGDFEPPKILSLRELPPQNPAEIAGTRQRVAFTIEERMTPQYAARRVNYLKQLLNAPQKQRPFKQRTLRLSLARMQRNRQITQGVATLAKTTAGWQIKATSGPSPGDWAYDLAYER